MNGVDEFTAKFTTEKISFIQLRRDFFHASDDLLKFKESIPFEPFACGTFLGSGNPFNPSNALLDWLNERTENFVVVDKKSAWLFLCGRDVFASSIVKRQASTGPVLVRNQQGELLGYGELTNNKKIPLKNILDKGDFLRREMHKHGKRSSTNV